MARIHSPVHDKSVPKRVSKPTVTAEAAATVAESVVAAPGRAVRRKPASKPKSTAAAPVAKKAAPAKKAKAVPAKKVKAAPAAKSKAKAKAKPAAAESAPPKPAKAHKPKLVRDSFTIPKDEYAVLEALKTRALGLGQHVRKSELLRAGIQALHAMGERAFLQAVGAVPTLKTGRPKKG
jgi:hypothetical protein